MASILSQFICESEHNGYKKFMYKLNSIVIKIQSYLILSFFAISITSCSSDNSIISEISFPTIEFTISSKNDTTIFGNQGTRLFIEKGTFQFNDGTLVNDSINIELKEFYKMSDIILANLSTESNGNLLETAGMLQISAKSKGQEVKIASDKRIVVHFPKQKNSNKSMNLFYGNNNSNVSAATNWVIDTVNLLKQTPKIEAFGYTLLSERDSTPFILNLKNPSISESDYSPLELYINNYPFTSSTIEEIKMNNVIVHFTISPTAKIKKTELGTKIGKEAESEIINLVNNLPALEPGRNNKNEPVEREGLFVLVIENSPIQQNDQEYIKSFDNKYSKYENKPIKNMKDAELNYYVFSISKLGWINCDRFYEEENTIDYIVKAPYDKDTQIKMIFKDIKGILIAKNKNENYSFENVPIDKPVIIFGIKNKNGILMTSFTETKITAKPLENLVFKETTLAELKQELEKLN